jgi:two-component system OmpR family response regulator
MSEHARNRVKESTILIIAYDYIIRDIFTRFLTTEGHKVIAHSLGWSGMRSFEKGKGKFDLVIIDIPLPDMSGVGVAKKIKAISHKTPIMLLKGWDIEPEEEEIKGSGVDFIVSKPFSMEETLCLVANAIEREAG